MRDLNLLNQYRKPHHLGGWGDGRCGQFLVPHAPTRTMLRVIAANDEGWDHVSVSTKHRIPLWDEMQFIRTLFFEADECVVQFHPPLTQHINIHPHVLHLWRQHGVTYALPPEEFV